MSIDPNAPAPESQSSTTQQSTAVPPVPPVVEAVKPGFTPMTAEVYKDLGTFGKAKARAVAKFKNGSTMEKITQGVGVVLVGKGLYDLGSAVMESEQSLQERGGSRLSGVGVAVLETGLGLGGLLYNGKTHAVGH